jgi:hypothetical protein
MAAAILDDRIPKEQCANEARDQNAGSHSNNVHQSCIAHFGCNEWNTYCFSEG